MTTLVLICALLALAGEPEKAVRFSDIEIDKSFEPYLLGNPLLMEVAGAKLIRLPDGKSVVVAVASTVLKDNSPQERLRAEKVCRIKAITSLVSDEQGVQIAHSERLNDRTVIVFDGDKESGTSISELLQVTEAKVQGIAKDLPVVGRWRSQSGDVFYLASGGMRDANGKPAE